MLDKRLSVDRFLHATWQLSCDDITIPSCLIDRYQRQWYNWIWRTNLESNPRVTQSYAEYTTH